LVCANIVTSRRQIGRDVSTNHSSFDRCIQAYASPGDDEDGGYYAHHNQSKLPLNGECYDETGEKERDALDAGIQLFRRALVDPVTI
jgi:hypothetical protein